MNPEDNKIMLEKLDKIIELLSMKKSGGCGCGDEEEGCECGGDCKCGEH